MKRLLIATAIVAILAVAAVIAWRQRPLKETFYTDAATIKAPIDTAPLREILWQPPERLPDIINADENVYEARMSADRMTLFFVRGKAGHNADIYTTRRTLEGWTEPKPLTAVNSPYDDLGPEPSADGKSLYFYTNRPGGLGGYDIWVAHRPHDGRSDFGEPISLGPAVNSDFNDYGPALSPDARTLYFSSNRPQKQDDHQPDPNAWPATLRENLYTRTYDLYLSPITDRGAGEVQPLTALNTPNNEGAPAVSPVEDFLYFSSDRPGGEGGFDLYRSRRLRGEHQPPENLGPPVNTVANELDPGLSVEGYALYFSSDRMTDPPTAHGPPTYTLYRTSSREVFRDLEITEKPPIDWAGLWALIGPNLLWALLALLLALLLLAIMGDLKRKKLSLLARCLLASLLAHLLLLLLFNLWEVTAAVAGQFRRGGEIRVALASPTGMTDITAQLLTGLTDIETPPPMQTPTNRRVEPIEFKPVSATTRLAVDRNAIEIQIPTEQMLTVAEAPTTKPPKIPEHEIEIDPTDNALAVDPALPKTETLTAETERSASDQIDPSRQAPIDHQSLPVKAMQTTNVAVRMTPDSSDAKPLQEDTASMAATAVPRDATTPPKEAATTATTPIDLDPLPANEFVVTVPSSGRMAEVDERQPDVPAPVATSLRPDLTADSEFVFSGEVTDRFTPELNPLSAANVSLAAAVLNRIPTDELSLVFASFTGPTTETIVPMSDVSLPYLEEAVIASAIETAPMVAAAAPVSPRPTAIPRSENPTTVSSLERFEVATVSMLEAGSDSLVDPQQALRHATPQPPRSEARRARTDFPSVITEALNLELSLPTEERPPQDPYAQRSSEQRMDIVQRMGGSEETERAVKRALEWLARHQSDDGHWDGQEFDTDCGGCDGDTDFDVDHALTGLATLCFLGAGHTHVEDGTYRATVARALNWLRDQQKPDGDLRGDETMYSHGIASIALSEAFAMTHDPELADPVRRAVDFIQRARNRDIGGWRYDPGQPGDTSVLGWQIMALKSATIGGIEVPRDAFDTARRWLEIVSDSSRPGLYAYRPNRPPTPSMTAEGMFVQQLLGRGPDDPRMRQSADLIVENLPDWDDEPNTYFWYYASLALFQQQGPHWTKWNQAISEQLVTHQESEGPAAGSWPTEGRWARIGGRVYQTALCTLMLEVYYRYLPLNAIQPGEPEEIRWLNDAVGGMRGVVHDVSTGEPLPGAVVHIDLPDRAPLTVMTDDDGFYVLFVPEMPDFFAVSASHPDFVPDTQNVDSSEVEGTTITLDFRLQPIGNEIVVTEIEPQVHHLGDDAFNGAINSQFQKNAEGTEFEAEFTLRPEQRPPFISYAEVRMLAKGVQRQHRIFVNGHLLDQRLESAPRDGSFGEFRAAFDPQWLQPDTNTIRIVAKPSNSDVDDFEFINILLHLSR